MDAVCDIYCPKCRRPLHLLGNPYYVSGQANRFYNTHKDHGIFSLRHDHRWKSLDTAHDGAMWWADTFESEEYQAYLLEEIARNQAALD
jgi:hypothetical protein